jgi:ribosome biogenesis ATPase
MRARASSPCVIFFDELDALVPRRDESMVRSLSFPSYAADGDLQSESSARVVNTLLTELDGLDSRKAVYVIGATNRPDMIDPAMVRPGRLDKLLYVDLPSPSERVDILRTHTSRTPIDEVSWSGISSIVTSDKCDGFSGADIAALVREAATLALRSALEIVGAFESDTSDTIRDTRDVRVTVDHFEKAAIKTLPSVSREQRLKYERMRDKYAGVPTKGRRMRDAEEVKSGQGTGESLAA